MTKHSGLWIDHREAVIVSLTEKTEAVQRVTADLAERIHFSGNAEPLTTEDMLDRRFAHHLQHYFKDVIAALGDADEILIFGPGEAKGELAKRLQAANLGDRIVDIETADRLTDRQIVAHVRRWFQHRDRKAAVRA